MGIGVNFEKITDQSVTEDKDQAEPQHQPTPFVLCMCVGGYTLKDFKSSEQD